MPRPANQQKSREPERLDGQPLTLEVILFPPPLLDLQMPVAQCRFPRVIARPGACADGSPSAVIVLPMPPHGGTVVAEVSLRSFLEAAALLEAAYGRQGGVVIAPAAPRPAGGRQ